MFLMTLSTLLNLIGCQGDKKDKCSIFSLKNSSSQKQSGG